MPPRAQLTPAPARTQSNGGWGFPAAAPPPPPALVAPFGARPQDAWAGDRGVMFLPAPSPSAAYGMWGAPPLLLPAARPDPMLPAASLPAGRGADASRPLRPLNGPPLPSFGAGGAVLFKDSVADAENLLDTSPLMAEWDESAALSDTCCHSAT